jgi:hypothetical protein
MPTVTNFRNRNKELKNRVLRKNIIDKTTYVKRTFHRYSTLRTRVPSLATAVPSTRNIAPEYTGYILQSSKVHTPGTVYWDTATTYEQPGTIVRPKEFLQVRRTPRRGLNILRSKWDCNVYYPKEGTSILKKRRFPLDRTVTRFLNSKNASCVQIKKAKHPAKLQQEHFSSVLAYLKGTWVPQDTPLNIYNTRPADTEYYPTYLPSDTVVLGIGTNTGASEKRYRENFSTPYKHTKEIPSSRFEDEDNE